MADVDEGVCFTAGPQGAAFGAGVIHAYLAADRKAPRVVAGISTGAISAAAFQRSMLERGPDVEKATRTEAGRWGWFQRYLSDILDRPLDVIWKAFPDPVDLISPTVPVRDLSCPAELKDDECASRYHFWLLTQLGSWISQLTISIGEIGRLAILQVRREEKVPVPFLGKGFVAGIWRNGTFAAAAYIIGLRVIANLIAHPLFTRTCRRFTWEDAKLDGRKPKEGPGFIGIRPLFGWLTWLTASLVGGSLVVFVPAALLLVISPRYDFGAWTRFAGIVCALIVAMHLAVGFSLRKKSFRSRLKKQAGEIGDSGVSIPTERSSLGSKFISNAMRSAGIELSLIHSYQKKRRIWNRFFDPDDKDKLLVKSSEDEETSVVIVAAVLQSLGSKNKQTWAQHGSSLVNALTASCALERVFPPTHVQKEDLALWLRKKERDRLEARGVVCEGLDLIDGSAIRKNPLPALFNWFQENPRAANALESDSLKDPRIHVIYNVPIEPFDAYGGQEAPDRIDLVEAAEVGVLMRARRDTSTEVLQTNYLSRINCAEAAARRQVGSLPLEEHEVRNLAIFAGEIAPERELKFENRLAPSRDEGLALTAQGCRRTLGRLYQNEIQAFAGANHRVNCNAFLRTIAPARTKAIHIGLPEVCAKCSGWLEPYPQPPHQPPLVHSDYGVTPKNVSKAVGNLCDVRQPRIVFVASGGVFRGAFHIGLLGAMQALRITPDLVVGASVGTLMGAALANMRSATKKSEQFRILADLSDTFLHVDEKVSLTVPVKSAVKRLGLRARKIDLSPAKLRRVVGSGTRKDVGYAASGVPPIVIDMLSDLFIIPPIDTIRAGSDFVAGRFSKAASALIDLVRQNTLESLGVRYAVIGTSLLEGAARVLLGGTRHDLVLQSEQPYLSKDRKKGIAIFCTTAFVNQRWPLLLGRDSLHSGTQAFNFLYAALSSSAFPAAFSPRQESEVFPGAGTVTNLFCDGGTFDNLPFIPTIDLLQETQVEAQKFNPEDPRDFLKRRLEAPDLILSGAFDPAEHEDHRAQFTSQRDIAKRAAALGSSVKTESFISISGVQRKRLKALLKHTENMTEDQFAALDGSIRRMMTGSVVAHIINVVPSTELHVNPTFGFSRTLGFEEERVGASIADGCFQTLLNLQGHRAGVPHNAIDSLNARGIDVKLGPMKGAGGCPYFQVFCPFFRASFFSRNSNKQASAGCKEIYNSCKKDPVHHRLFQIEKSGFKTPHPAPQQESLKHKAHAQ